MSTITPVNNGDTGLVARTSINNNFSNLNTDKLESSLKGASNGLAELDGSGLLPVSQLPVSAMEYKGTWVASTNTPTLSNGAGTNGDVYKASDSGTVDFGAGNISFVAGDWVIYNGSIWEKSINSESVSSVHGRTGVVVSANGDYTASQVTNVPSGGIAATNVQLAIDELGQEKENFFTKNTAFNKDFGSIAGTVTEGNDARLSDARTCDNTFLDSATSRFNLGVGAVGDNVFVSNSAIAAQNAMGVRIGVDVQAYSPNYALINQANAWSFRQDFGVTTSLVQQVVKFSNFSIVATDAGATVFCSNTIPITCTVPTNAVYPAPFGTTIAFVQAGPGQLDFDPSGGVILRSKNNHRKVAAQWSSAAIQKIGTDEWLLIGDLVA